MPSEVIKSLRQAGKIDEALKIAKAELNADPDNIRCKRNIAWVYYDYLKLNAFPDKFDSYITWLKKFRKLNLNVEEKMIFEQVSWQIGKYIFSLYNESTEYVGKTLHLFEVIQPLHFTRPLPGFSFLFKALHKGLKASDKYIKMVDWCGLESFMPDDFNKQSIPGGKEIMAFAEQVYITYAKHLLPRQDLNGDFVFDKKKALAFIPALKQLTDKYAEYQYSEYYVAKLMLAAYDKEKVLKSLLPIVRKNHNDFWSWALMAEAYSDDSDKILACYCKALSFDTPEEKLVNIRQKMAELLISKHLLEKAKTEIELLVKARKAYRYNIPDIVETWQTSDWYKSTSANRTNYSFYKEYTPLAESLLYSDIPEESVMVRFVNYDRNILFFIASESKFGCFMDSRILKNIRIGDILKVRFKSENNKDIYAVYTLRKSKDEVLKNKFYKIEEYPLKINPGEPFGKLNDIIIHSGIIKEKGLTDGMIVKVAFIKFYNSEKGQWIWRQIQD